MKGLILAPLLMFCAVSCSAQNDSLTIAPGDLLHVLVLDSPDLEQQHVRVTDGGDLHLILGGDIHVAGLSANDAARAIEQRLQEKDYVLSPHVTVTMESFVTKNVSVIGQVEKPGSFAIGTSFSVLDVLALAGGLNSLADRNITIERQQSKEQIKYFVSNNASAALKDQPLVYPGDTVLVPRASIVYVLGDVGHPGGFAATTNSSQLSALQALALAGGTPPTAVPSKARLIRKSPDGTYIEIALQLSDMQKGKRSDIQLKPDDIIFVPYSYLKNMAVNLDALVAAAATASIYRF